MLQPRVQTHALIQLEHGQQRCALHGASHLQILEHNPANADTDSVSIPLMSMNRNADVGKLFIVGVRWLAALIDKSLSMQSRHTSGADQPHNKTRSDYLSGFYPRLEFAKTLSVQGK
jgi:hypothetical protein